ncbi:hypothetical protein DH2020_027322 [Rehmannia glutinosa]|uniref:Ubiquitin-like protease family profile domain-containing protein n=1 Tax=Rehmannia glutinosa TaxID=99300 RepID=A0ABR0VXF3_REHGL
MGALTNNRKRGDDYFKSLVPPSSPIDQSCIHITKKPKLSVSPYQNTPDNSRYASSNSIVSRLSQYPDRKSGFSREVHAPVRNSRFGPFSSAKNSGIIASSKESPADKMGVFSVFSRLSRYEKVKDVAIRSLRYAFTGKQKEKEVIEVDSEDENQDDVADDSSIEEVEIVDFVGSKRKGGRGDVENSQKLNVKMVEKEVRSFDSSMVTDASNAVAKAADWEKNVFMQLDQMPDDSGVPRYKRLYDQINKRDGKLASLKFDIELNEKRIQWFHLLRPQKKEEQIKVINLYLELLKEREKRAPQKFLKCHFFNTFFYKKIFVPIHKEVHWCLAIINKKDEKFQYLDSLKGVDSQVLNVLARYFVDEVKDKCGKDINVSSWERELVEELPEQANGFDCGVFMIKYADFYSRDIGLCFSQEDMPYFRRRTAKEILKLRAE